MSANPATTISWDYLIEFNDDAKQPVQHEPEIITMPPVPPAPGGLPTPATASGQGTQT